MVIWRLPHTHSKRPHGLKYRLYNVHADTNALESVDLVQRTDEGLLVAPWDVIDAHVRLVA